MHRLPIKNKQILTGSTQATASRKHTYIILTPLNTTFILQNWGLQGYTLFFLFCWKNMDCEYSLEPHHRGGSNEYPQSMFWEEIWNISEFFYLKIFLFWL